MSIIHSVKDKLPNDGDMVYCDNGKYAGDRAIYRNGEFTGGGEFPVRPYTMSQVCNWFDFNLYMHCARKKNICTISFDQAETMSDDGYVPEPIKEYVDHNPVKPYSESYTLSSGRKLTLTIGGDV
jgi:hypothetical protein